MWMMACVPLWAQTSHRDSLLAEARYLKSIYRTDDAIEKLSELVQPEAMDEGVLAELADCHFQSGDFENASGTYFHRASRPGRLCCSWTPFPPWSAISVTATVR